MDSGEKNRFCKYLFTVAIADGKWYLTLTGG
jgi:hypothetical protein